MDKGIKTPGPPFDGMIFSHKKEGSTGTCYTWCTLKAMLYEAGHRGHAGVKGPEVANPEKTGSRECGCQGCGEGNWGVTADGEFLFGVMKM